MPMRINARRRAVRSGLFAWAAIPFTRARNKRAPSDKIENTHMTNLKMGYRIVLGLIDMHVYYLAVGRAYAESLEVSIC